MVETRQPVEIELTPTEPPRERRRQASPDRPPGEPGRSSPLSTERGRLVAVAACAALLALLVGWAAGRATGSDEPATAPATTLAREPLPPEAPAPETTVPEPEETRPPTTGPRPTTRRTTTTTIPPRPVVTQVAVHESLAGMPVTIVGSDMAGRYVELDLATGMLQTRQLGPLFNSVVVRAGPDWVLVIPQDGARQSWLIPDGGEPVPVDLGSAWDTYWIDGSPVMWRSAVDPSTSEMVVEAIGPDGEPTGEAVVLPDPQAYPQAADPRGGVIVALPGGAYRLSMDGVELLTTGQIYGLSAERMVTYECDASAQCGLRAVDRDTGESTVVDIDVGEIMPEWNQWRMSPDGSQLVVQLVSRIDSQGYAVSGQGVLDLDDRTITSLGSTGFSSSVAWTPDGRYVIFLGRAIMALDLATGEIFPVVDDGLPDIAAFAVRPAPALNAG